VGRGPRFLQLLGSRHGGRRCWAGVTASIEAEAGDEAECSGGVRGEAPTQARDGQDTWGRADEGGEAAGVKSPVVQWSSSPTLAHSHRPTLASANARGQVFPFGVHAR
jgi:hypothetical protein